MAHRAIRHQLIIAALVPPQGRKTPRAEPPYDLPLSANPIIRNQTTKGSAVVIIYGVMYMVGEGVCVSRYSYVMQSRWDINWEEVSGGHRETQLGGGCV